MTLETLEIFSNISNVCKTENAENMHNRESMQIRSSISTPVQLARYLSNSKKVKCSPPYCSWTRCFELIAQPATLSARYAVCSAQIRFGDLGSLQQPTLPELPCEFKLY